jgi:predicted TIM-barrel fold metal-dependent hydrolase
MTDKILIVSGDSHTGAPPEAYREYLDAQYRPLLEGLAAENKRFLERGVTQERYSQHQLEVMDERGLIRGGGLMGAWDPGVRVKQMDTEGIAAEILLPGHQLATLPFFGIVNEPVSAEVRAAGARAYHRWLADMMAESHGRLFGVADAGPSLDMAATVSELKWAAAHGFVSVTPPGFTADPALPPLSDRYYEPFWAACVELGLTVTVHVGYGVPQMNKSGFMQAAGGGLPPIGSVPEEERVVHRREKDGGKLNKVLHTTRRVMWQMMLSGALDRHPDLKLVFTEIRADWVPATLAYLDAEFAQGGFATKLKPSEYWRRHFHVTPSSPRDYEVAQRNQIGVEQWLFGTDYPHPEGTWPNTLDWIRTVFAGVPEREARRMLGENAVDCYGLDRSALAKVAERIGPSVEDVLGGKHKVSPGVVADFDRRSGFASAMEQVDPSELGRLLHADVAQATANAH